MLQDPQTNRTLTLISKTIQSLGNLVSSRSAQQVCKEEYMAELYRSFCTPRHVRCNTFVDKKMTYLLHLVNNLFCLFPK